MKILIIRFSSIGDIVLTTPVIRCVKQQVKDVQVHYLTKLQFKGIVETNPNVDKVHVLQDSFRSMMQELKQEKFDAVIDLHHNLRTLRIKWAMGKPAYSFQKLNFEKWLLVNLRINKLPRIHIVDRYLDQVSFMGVKNDGKGLDYFIPSRDEVSRVGNFYLNQPYAAVVIGATHFTKRMPAERIIEICRGIKLPVVLLGGKTEAEEGRKIAETCGAHVVNTCGQFNLNQSASVVRQSALVVSHDTGLMHIAAAFKKPVVSVWGNTIPEFGMYPYYGEQRVPQLMAEVKDLSCRPCSKIGSARCPKGHFNCMQLQDVKQIIRFADSPTQ